MRKRGFSVIEILVAVAMVVILAALFIGPFSRFRESQLLNSETENVLTLLSQARTQTLSSQDASQWGIHFQSDKTVLFKGVSYSATDPNNRSYDLNPKVQILPGGITDVLFQRLTGKTAQPGTVTLSLVSDPSKFRTIKIETTGLAGLQ